MPVESKATPANRMPVDKQPVGIVETTIVNEILDPRPSQPVALKAKTNLGTSESFSNNTRTDKRKRTVGFGRR
jgi:hypothetical protein